MVLIAAVRLCPRCGRPLALGQQLCSLDVLFMARQATNAYDSVKARDPGADSAQLEVAAIAWIESGHIRHRGGPQVGCPFCRLVP